MTTKTAQLLRQLSGQKKGVFLSKPNTRAGCRGRKTGQHSRQKSHKKPDLNQAGLVSVNIPGKDYKDRAEKNNDKTGSRKE